ncbi:MAG: shikimate kinase [Eubacteriales bacterium]|nr:shikimate kinase [Eubacteriales bacterium]
MKYGLIGEKLGHSFSPAIHKILGNNEYELTEIKKNKLDEFMQKKDFIGINVTLPYKKDVLPYLSQISDKAKKIGCVNVVVKKEDGSLVGDNTDYDGVKYMLENTGIEVTGKKCLILGNGATSLTVFAVLSDLGAKEIIKIYRKGEMNFENVYSIADAQIIVNTTPVGMYPENEGSLIDLSRFPMLEGVADVIYNPIKTNLILQAERLGIKCSGGLKMLVAQAKYASDIFFNTRTDDSVIDEIYQKIIFDIRNIAFVGMPGCGKSSIAKLVAEKMEKKFIDTDSIIVDLEGREIPEIFAIYGEKYFRSVEIEACRIAGKRRATVISLGGGAVTNRENIDAIRQNALVFYIKRDIDKLSRTDRPLSKDMDTLWNIYEERKDKYEQAADYIVYNNENIEACVDKVIELIYKGESR